MLKPRNKTRIPQPLPLVKIRNKTCVNQSATVAAIMTSAQKITTK